MVLANHRHGCLDEDESVRTHNGDPDRFGRFGMNDCMGRVRARQFDAVVGVSGIGAEPKSVEIAGKVNWIVPVSAASPLHSAAAEPGR